MKINQLHLYDPNEETEQKNQFLNPSKNVSSRHGYKQEIQQKNKAYLKALQEQNKILIAKIKEYDLNLNNQLQIMNKKIVSPYKKRSIVPKFQEMETKELKNKFQEFQKLKKQIYAIKEGNQSLQFLENMKEEDQNKLRVLKEKIKVAKVKLEKLKKIQKQSEKQQNKSNQMIDKLGEYNFYDSQIAVLKHQVKSKNDTLLKKKSQLSNRIIGNRANKSTINIVNSQPSVEKQQLPAQVLSLKRQYQLLGKKIDILKLKKHNLQKSLKQQNHSKNQLQKIKHKYNNLVKAMK